MAPTKKVIVIGLDGLEPRIAEPMLNAGALPNLAGLKTRGGYSRLSTTYPAQTPVAWSTFATGTNPGGHGIFDFIRRDPKTYLPDFSLTRYEQKKPYLPPKVINLRRGAPVWEHLSRADIPSTILRCPCTYPPDSIRGRMLAGMGVPDLRGSLGTPTFYASSSDVKARESENALHVSTDNNGVVTTYLIGPRNPKTRSDLQFEIKVHLEKSSQKVIVQSEGEPKNLEVRLGQWSDWLKLKFKAGLLQSVHGMVRFYLVGLDPVFELYASPVNFDTDAPLFPISSPPEYAKELANTLGSFYTTGMVEDHGGLANGRISEEAYLDQCASVLLERERMMLYELNRLKQGLFFCLFDTPDRVQHMFWRFRESEHPANHGPVKDEMRQVIEEHYRACDTIVGRALQFVDDQTLFIVLSDHGMCSFQRGFNTNRWLYDKNFLALKEGIKPGEETGDFFHGVDWDRTKAYALGFTGIYLNLKGREERGVVTPEEAEMVKTAIVKGLSGLQDPGRGGVAIRSVVAREEVYSGECAFESPDLLLNFSEGYRASWSTPIGGVGTAQFEDNSRKWSADHAVDPILLPGVLLMNRPFQAASPRLIDLAPTILTAFGLPVEPPMEGSSLLISPAGKRPWI